MQDRALFTLLFMVVLGLIWSGIAPQDSFTWLLEVLPVLIALPLLWHTRQHLRFTPLLYGLIALHCGVLMVGGHYTYAEVPLGFWMQEAFGLARNHYDRIGHFMQGLVPAMISREILLRKTPLKTGGMVGFLAICVAMFISSSYELIEMAVARATGEAATAFLGTQGDIWDTQMDMLLALMGACASQWLLARWHDRQLAGVEKG